MVQARIRERINNFVPQRKGDESVCSVWVTQQKESNAEACKILEKTHSEISNVPIVDDLDKSKPIQTVGSYDKETAKNPAQFSAMRLHGRVLVGEGAETEGRGYGSEVTHPPLKALRPMVRWEKRLQFKQATFWFPFSICVIFDHPEKKWQQRASAAKTADKRNHNGRANHRRIGEVTKARITRREVFTASGKSDEKLRRINQNRNIPTQRGIFFCVGVDMDGEKNGKKNKNKPSLYVIKLRTATTSACSVISSGSKYSGATDNPCISSPPPLPDSGVRGAIQRGSIAVTSRISGSPNALPPPIEAEFGPPPRGGPPAPMRPRCSTV
jgi:hypothetical protein